MGYGRNHPNVPAPDNHLMFKPLSALVFCCFLFFKHLWCNKLEGFFVAFIILEEAFCTCCSGERMNLMAFLPSCYLQNSCCMTVKLTGIWIFFFKVPKLNWPGILTSSVSPVVVLFSFKLIKEPNLPISLPQVGALSNSAVEPSALFLAVFQIVNELNRGAADGRIWILFPDVQFLM